MAGQQESGRAYGNLGADGRETEACVFWTLWGWFPGMAAPAQGKKWFMCLSSFPINDFYEPVFIRHMLLTQ